MVVCCAGETLAQLSIRLDPSIGMAMEDEIFIDEINNGADATIRMGSSLSANTSLRDRLP